MVEAAFSAGPLLEWLQHALGVVSATLVAIIALGFGALFVFFSGASALVMGQFVRFARPPSVGLPAQLVAVLAWAVAASQVGVSPWWVVPLMQLVFGGISYALLYFGVPRRFLLRPLGVLLLLAGAIYVAALFVPAAILAASIAIQVASLILLGGAMGVVPLIIGGLLRHRAERPVEWFISLRYLVARRRQTFISIISIICVTGVALGVAVITVVLSVMNGFSRVWEDKVLGTRAHFIVQSVEGRYPDYEPIREDVLRVPGVLGATPFVQTEAILRGGSGELEAILLKGIDPATVGEATQLPQNIILGSLDALGPEASVQPQGANSREADLFEGRLEPGVEPVPVGDLDGRSGGVVPASDLQPSPSGESTSDESAAASDKPSSSGKPSEKQYPGIILGAQLADRYFLSPGDPVILISPLGGPSTPLGPAPRMSRFQVAGVFKSNFFEFDQRFAYASLEAVQEFMKLPDVVDGIEVRTEDPYRSGAIGRSAELELAGGFYSIDWKSFYPGFFNALKTERVMMFVLLSFIMVVAGFIIIATLIMMIMEKSRDIAILKTMGCEDSGVLRVFAIQGFLIGIAGLGLGLGIGLVITWNLDVIQGVVERLLGVDVLPPNVYQLQQLPYDVVPEHLVLISLIAMVLSVGATLLPSWQAARLDPAEALRFE